MQENESRRTERANQQNFVRDEREPQFGEYTEENEKRAYAAEEHEIVNPLLPVPLDCAVFEAYVLLSLSTLLHNERLRCRHYFMAGQAVEHELAGFAAHIRRDGKWSAVRQSLEQSRVFRQMLTGSLFARHPIDEDIRPRQITKHQLHRD